MNPAKSIPIYTYAFLLLVNGGWGDWTDWVACAVSCGGADQGRTRVCDKPAPQFGGTDCTVDGSKASDTQRCNENPCPSKLTIILVNVL